MKKLFANKWFNWISWSANVVITIAAPVLGFGIWFVLFCLWLIFAEK